METAVTLKHLSFNLQLKAHIEKRLNMLEEHTGVAFVYLLLEQNRFKTRSFTVKSKLYIEHQTINACCVDKCVYTAINRLIKKVEKQIRSKVYKRVKSTKGYHHNLGFIPT